MANNNTMKTVHLLLLLCTPLFLFAQQASIKEEVRSLKTYPFSDPNPIPILSSNSKIYPYFKFDGYASEGQPKDWKTVHLENDLIELWVLPEVGGKVWGAREKATGKEFIYRNEVMKFRNIAMRGPWTSGGIEFNFGIIGHHPATATPVDYVITENEDGSVSCVVGTIDLPSRTQWRVKITLPKDKAYFETEALWYNPTAQHQSYYNWMTAAAAATEDLEFFCPGDQYVKHSGEPRPFPNEYGRNIAKYNENNFGGSKSYHVVGEHNDFFGGYFHEQDYGFGHWSLYEEMPGQKLWIWALSRAGGIWEDLLTDTDGQYIEFQAGRLFDQYFPGETNPISQVDFTPHTSDQWRELWFPVKSIGGLSDVSETAVLNVNPDTDQLVFGVNALEQASGTIKILAEEEVIYEKVLSMTPMAVFQDSLQWNMPENWTIEIAGMDLRYESNPEIRQLARPFEPSSIEQIPPFEQHFRAGVEAKEYRNYQLAKEQLQACLATNPAHLEALSHLAEIHYWEGKYEAGIKLILEALAIDTYHPQANYIGGILYKAKGDLLNAKEMLGWAARSMQYRSSAYALMAEIALIENNLKQSVHYATKALDFNRFNVVAYQCLTVANRLADNTKQVAEWTQQLLTLDPLSHFAHFEKSLADKSGYKQLIQNELPYQSYLELALTYYNMGQHSTAIQVLEDAPDQPLVGLWKAYLKKDVNSLKTIENQSVEFVFPYRNETLVALQWAIEQSNHWKWQYYLGLNLWGKNRKTEASKQFEAIGQEANQAVVYLSRANLNQQIGTTDISSDLNEAVKLSPKNWRTHQAYIKYLQAQKQYAKALKASEQATSRFPDSYVIASLHIKNLIHEKQYQKAVQQLEQINVLPFEGAYEGRQLYEWAHYGLALQMIEQKQFPEAEKILLQSKEWKENLGVGKPYHPDERMADYLLLHLQQKTNQLNEAEATRQRILTYTQQFPNQNNYHALLGLKLMDKEALSDFVIRNYPVIEKLSTPLKWSVYQAIGDTKNADTIATNFDDLSFRLMKDLLNLQ